MTAPPAGESKPTGVEHPMRRAGMALGLLLAINLFNYVDRQVLAAVVPHLKSSLFGNGQTHGMEGLLGWCEWHLGFKPENALIGLLSMAFMVCYMVAAPLFGKLGARYSRWLIIGLAVMVWSLASGASGLAVTFVGLLLTRCLVGIGEAAYGPVAPALLSDYYPLKVRGRVLSIFYLAIPVGSALGYVLGEQVAKSGIGTWAAGWLGRETESWRWAFYLVVLPGLALGAWAMTQREPLPVAGAEKPKGAGVKDYLGFFRIPSFVYCTLGMAAMTFAIGGIGFWMPYYLEHLPGKPGSPTTIFGGLTVISGLLATLAGGWAGDRLRERLPGSYFLVSGVAMLVGFPVFVAALYAGYPWIWPGIFLACFCLFFNTGPTNTILANIAPPSLRPAAFALNIFIIHLLGDVISPVIVGLVADRWSLRAGFLVVGMMFVVSGLLWLAGSRHLARDTELAVRGEAPSSR